MAVVSNTLIAGFNDPVQDAQQVFRAALKAMSEPGTQMSCSFTKEAPEGLENSSWQLALTLFDADTKVWLSPALAQNDAVISNLRFHCQCPLIKNAAEAHFALCNADELPFLADFNWGNAEYPDHSTSLIVQVPAISDEPFWTLTGPGIETQRSLRISGLPEHFRADLIRSRQRFPLGIDTFYCCGDQLVALPRTTQIEEAC